MPHGHTRASAAAASRTRLIAVLWLSLVILVVEAAGGDQLLDERGVDDRAALHDPLERLQELVHVGDAALQQVAGPFAAGSLASGLAIVSDAGPSSTAAAEPSAAANGRVPVARIRTDGGVSIAPDLLAALLPHGSIPDAIAPGADGPTLDVPSDGTQVTATAASCPPTDAIVGGCLPPIGSTPVGTTASSVVRHQVPDRR